MAASTHSFIDIAALDAVRRHFAAGDGVIVLTTDLTQVIWANGPGAAILGFPGIEAAIGAESGLGRSARRQIEATPGYPDIGSDKAITVRMATGLISQVTMFRASRLLLPGDETAIMLVVPFGGGASRSEEEIAERAISGFDEPGHYLALLDAGGRPRAATPGFDRLGMEAADLSRLASDMTGQRDRLLKRIVRVAGHAMPVGVARLCDDPAVHLLITVDERQMAAEPLEAPAAVVDDSQVAALSETVDERPEEAGEHPSDAAEQPESAALSDDENATPAEAEDASDAAVMQETLEEASPAAAPEERVEAEPPHEEPEIRVPAASAIDRSAAPVRFVWRTDAEGRFTCVSPEFVDAVGAPAADIVGKSFSEVASRLALDPDGEIAALLERRDTWSGRSVLWPVAGTELMAPVDLAALPAYDRERRFEGFRGFGVVRLADAVADPRRTGLALNEADAGPAEAEPQAPIEEASGESGDPFRGEVPALDVASRPRERRYTDKVIRLAEHRPPANDKGLSPLERIAFREIGEHLKRTSSGARTAEGTEDVTGETAVAKAADEGAAEVEQTAASNSASTAAEDPAADEPAAEREASETERPEASLEIEQPEDEAAAEQVEASASQKEAAGGDGVPAADIGSEPVEDEARPYTSRSLFDFVDRAAEPAAVAAPPLKQSGFLPSAFAERRADTSILAQLPIPVLIHSGDTLHYANDAFFQLTGYGSVEELAARGGLDALLSGPAENRREGDNRVLLRSSDGAEFPVSAFLQSVPWLGGKALLLTLTRQPAPAVTDTALREKELEARLAELRTILDTATDGVVLIDNDGIVRSISRPAEALFGYESEQIVGKPFTALFAIESQRSAQDYLSGLSGTGVASVLNDGREVIGREAQGRFIPLFMTIGRLPGEGGYCAVLRDITQWKRAEEDLTQARAQAERTSSQKSDFLARVSHEIRTPLNAIIGFSELMLDEKFGPITNDRYRDYLRDINRSGNHVLDLVNDLLDISKIEAGQQEMEYEAISLNDALTETVAMMQPQANRERVIIRSSLASKLPEVVADLRSVRQIALNILSNAVRYTQAGGQVIVSTAYEPNGEVVMRVRDTGIGMTPSEIEQALKPFKQVNALKRARGDGTGLGLPLTKAMVEANRAKFAIYSTPGEGTLVEVTFPSTRVLAG